MKKGQRARLGIIGASSIVEIAHFPAIKEAPQAELISICDIDRERAEKAATKQGVGSFYTDYRQMLDKEKLDLVIVASPNKFHYEQAIDAAEAGVNAIVEKPLAGTNREAWEIVEAFKKRNLKLMVGCNQRFWLQHEWGEKLIRDGVIGKAIMGRSSLHEDWSLYQRRVAYTKFRYDPKLAAGAALYDIGAHRIDLLRWLMGSEAKRVVGIAKRVVAPESLTKTDDVVWILIEFENGSSGCVSCNRFSPIVSNITEIYGTEGTMFLSSEIFGPFQNVPLAIYTNKDYSWETLPDVIKKWRYPYSFWPDDVMAKTLSKEWVCICPPREWSYTRMIKYQIGCIFEDKEPKITSGEDGAKAIEIMCAVIKSMETGGWVDLPLKEEVVPPYYEPQRR